MFSFDLVGKSVVEKRKIAKKLHSQFVHPTSYGIANGVNIPLPSPIKGNFEQLRVIKFTAHMSMLILVLGFQIGENQYDDN